MAGISLWDTGNHPASEERRNKKALLIIGRIMKILKILVSSLCVYPMTAFTTSKEVDVLHAIDTICADTWCEGAEFTFHTVTCSHRTKSCTVFFTMDDEQRFCDIAGVSTYADMLDGGELKPDIYQSISHCISNG